MISYRLLPLTAMLTTMVCAGMVCAGCQTGAQEPAVRATKSVDEVDAQIKNVEASTNIPAQAKQRVLANLQQERERVAKTQAGAK